MEENILREYLEHQVSLLEMMKKKYIALFELIIVPLLLIICCFLDMYLVIAITGTVNFFSFLALLKSAIKKDSIKAKIFAVALLYTDIAFVFATGSYMILYSNYSTHIMYYFIIIVIYILCSVLSFFIIKAQSKKDREFTQKNIKYTTAYSTIGIMIGFAVTRYTFNYIDEDTNLMIGAFLTFAAAVLCSLGVIFYYIYYLAEKFQIK